MAAHGSVAEAVAERFHMDIDFLEQTERGKTKNLRAVTLCAPKRGAV